MRTLEQLGISPAPWRLGEIGRFHKISHIVEDEKGKQLTVRTIGEPNARLIKSAPRIYECLRQFVDYLSLNNWTDRELDPFIEAADNALAAAGGESEEGDAK